MAPGATRNPGGRLISAIGGAVGCWSRVSFDILGGLYGRIVGWAVLGIAVGLGWARRQARAPASATARWAASLGGALGGFVYQVLTLAFPQAFGRAIAIIILGALIGFFIGLVTELLKQGSLMVVRSGSRNAREGSEYSLVKPVTVIGRAEESDVGLFGDQSVLPQHAIVRREGKNFLSAPRPAG